MKELATTLDAKIRPLEELVGIRAALQAENKRVVHCHGIFDLLYIGVIRHLQRAKELGDVLIVTLVADAQTPLGPAGLLFNETLRAEAVAALGHVDYVAVANSPSAVDAIQSLRPDVLRSLGRGPPGQREPRARDNGGRGDPARHGRTIGAAAQVADAAARHDPALHPHASRKRPAASCSRFAARILGPPGDGIPGEGPRACACCSWARPSSTNTSTARRSASRARSRCWRSATSPPSSLPAASWPPPIMRRPSATTSGMVTLLGTQDSHEQFIREKLDPKIDAMFLYMPGAPTIVKRRLVETYPFQKLFEIYTMEPEIPEAVSQGPPCAAEVAPAQLRRRGGDRLRPRHDDARDRRPVVRARTASWRSTRKPTPPTRDTTRYRSTAAPTSSAFRRRSSGWRPAAATRTCA